MAETSTTPTAWSAPTMAKAIRVMATRGPAGDRASHKQARRVEAAGQQPVVEEGDQHHRRPGGGGQQERILAEGGGLAEEELVDPTLVAVGQALDHGDQADAHREEGGEHDAQRSILLEPGGAGDHPHHRRAEQSGQSGAHQDGQRILGAAPQEPGRHPRQHRVRKRVAQARQTAAPP